MKGFFERVIKTYIISIKNITVMISVILSPLYLFLINNSLILPNMLLPIKPLVSGCCSLFAQFLIVEFIIAVLEIIAKNKTDIFALTGAILLSIFSFKAGWVIPEVIFLGSITALFSFLQLDFEKRVALRFVRVLLLIFAQVSLIF